MTSFIPSDYITTQAAYNIFGKKLFGKTFKKESNNFQNIAEEKQIYPLNTPMLYGYIQSPLINKYSQKHWKTLKKTILKKYDELLYSNKKSESLNNSSILVRLNNPHIRYKEISTIEKDEYIELGMQYTAIIKFILNLISRRMLKIDLFDYQYDNIIDIPTSFWLSAESKFDFGIGDSVQTIQYYDSNVLVKNHGILVIRKKEFDQIIITKSSKSIQMHILKDHENNIKTKSMQQINNNQNELDANFHYAQNVHTSFFIYIMLKVTKDLNITEYNQPLKKVVIDKLKEYLPDESKYSNNLINNMATLIRSPESKKGGNISFKNKRRRKIKKNSS